MTSDPLIPLLRQLAARYIWWQPPDEAVARPDRVMAQTMNLGDWDDVVALCNQVGEARLRQVLQHAEIGQFNARSWAYWHYRLGLARPGVLPPMPARRFG